MEEAGRVAATQWTTSFFDTLASAFEGGGGFAGAMKSLGSQGLGQIFSSITGGAGGGVTQALGKIFSGGGVLGKIGSIGTKIGGGIGKFLSLGLNGVPIVGPFLAAFGGPLLKGVGKLFKKMFGGPSEAELAGRKTAGAFRDSVIGTLNDGQLAEAANAALGAWRGNERGSQFLIGVRDAYVAVGKSAAEAERDVNRLWRAEKRGPEAVAAVQAEIEAVLQLSEESKRLHGDLDALRDAGQAAFDPAQIEPYLEKLLETSTITAQQAAELRALADEAHVDYQAMQRAAEAYGVELSALGPAFDQARISDAATVIVQDFELMTQEGADVNGVLRGMQDEVQALVTDALTAGVAIPEGMRPILTSLIEQGRLTDANGDKLTDLSGLTFAEPLAAKFDTLITKLTELIEKIAGRGGVTEAIDHIPREVEVGVGLRYREHDRPEGFAGVDVESARHGTPFRHHGRGTPAMLHGLERVMTGMEGRGIAAALERIQQGLGAIADLSGVRALAKGGLVTRPTLALLGEREPEVVIPQSQIGRLGTPVQVHVDARGALFANEYTSQRELARIISDVIVSDLEGTRRLGLH